MTLSNCLGQVSHHVSLLQMMVVIILKVAILQNVIKKPINNEITIHFHHRITKIMPYYMFQA